MTAAETIARTLALPCGAPLKNRLAKAAMTEGLADPAGRATEALVRTYGRWADGGAGLVMTGNVIVDGNHLERPGNVILADRPDEEAMDRLKAWAQAGTRGGTHLWMQISHAGRQVKKTVNPHPKAPSAVKLGLPGGQFGAPEPLSEREIEGLIGRFVQAAQTAKAAGFTGAQFHAAHGYLLSQFLSPRSNRRGDKWGGNLENRARMLRLIVQGVRQACGADFPIAVKLNSADFQKGGFAPEEALTVAAWLEEDGIDLLEISGGTYEQPAMMDVQGIEPVAHKRASTGAREAYFLCFAEDMRAKITVPLMVTGGFRTAAAMATAVAEHGVGIIGLGRSLMVDPDAPKKLLAGDIDALQRWEARLGQGGLLSVNSPINLVKAAAGFAVMAWYYNQFFALGEGRPADTNLGIWTAFARLQRHEKRWLRTRAGAIASDRQSA